MRQTKHLNKISIFIVGFVLMVFEVVASRLMAPNFGSSIYTWTSIISVVMAALSFGYYYGGRAADSSLHTEKLSRYMILTGMSFIYVVVLHGNIVEYFSLINISLEYRVLLASFILLFPSSFLIGLIFPYLTRLELKNIKESGETIGIMYAISSVGSILGTIFAGFYLVPNYTSQLIVISLGVVMTLMGIIFTKKLLWKNIGVIVLLGLFVFYGIFSKLRGYYASRGVQVNEGLYSNVYRFEAGEEGSSERRVLVLNSLFGVQSSLRVNNPKIPYFGYHQFFEMLGEYKRGGKSLVIGGSAMVIPVALSNKMQVVDVAEIDPIYGEITNEIFGENYPSNVNLSIIDGREFIRKTPDDNYDYIGIDAFNDGGLPPFHLTTKEFIEEVDNVLKQDGVLVMNLLGGVGSQVSKLLWAQYATLESVFEYVYVFQINPERENGNVMLVVSQEPIDFSRLEGNEYYHFVLNEYRGEIKEGEVLYDDFAPVEKLAGNLNFFSPIIGYYINYNFVDLLKFSLM